MRIFTDEKNRDAIIILKQKEAKNLHEAIMEACKMRPRKKTWKKIYETFEENLFIY